MTKGYKVMARDSVHVVANPNGGWSAKKEGSSKATKTFDNQMEAIAYARGLVSREGGEIVVHGRDGRIREKDRYGSDPRPPREKSRH